MKKSLRLTLSLLLAVIVLLSTLSPVLAADAQRPVARMSIFSYTAHAFDTGHSWLYFENISGESIVVGKYVLEPGAAVSVGIFKYTRKDGEGVYYNVEAYCAEKYGASGRVSLTQTITAADLEKVSRQINSKNQWRFTYNCASFAADIWNSVSGTRVFSGNTPSCLKTSIRTKSYEKNRPMQVPLASQCFKLRGSGAGAWLEPVSSGTLAKEL